MWYIGTGNRLDGSVQYRNSKVESTFSDNPDLPHKSKRRRRNKRRKPRKIIRNASPSEPDGDIDMQHDYGVNAGSLHDGQPGLTAPTMDNEPLVEPGVGSAQGRLGTLLQSGVQQEARIDSHAQSARANRISPIGIGSSEAIEEASSDEAHDIQEGSSFATVTGLDHHDEPSNSSSSLSSSSSSSGRSTSSIPSDSNIGSPIPDNQSGVSDTDVVMLTDENGDSNVESELLPVQDERPRTSGTTSSSSSNQNRGLESESGHRPDGNHDVHSNSKSSEVENPAAGSVFAGDGNTSTTSSRQASVVDVQDDSYDAPMPEDILERAESFQPQAYNGGGNDINSIGGDNQRSMGVGQPNEDIQNASGDEDEDDHLSDKEQFELLEEIQSAIQEEHESRRSVSTTLVGAAAGPPDDDPFGGEDGIIQPKKFYKGKHSRPTPREMATIGFGDIAQRFKFPRRGLDQARDLSQTLAASAVKDILKEHRGTLENPDEALPLEVVDEIAAAVLDGGRYKPGDGRNFYTLMKDRTGFSSVQFDCCRNSCRSYAETPDEDSCKDCGASRWKDSDEGPLDGREGRKKEAVKTHFYFPMRHRLLLWFSSRFMSSLLSTYRKKACAQSSSSDGKKRTIVDVWSGKIYRALLRAKRAFLDERELAFCCGFDRTKSFKTRKNKSVWPVILTCLNLPPEVRFLKRNVLVVGIIPGPKNPKNPLTFMRPMIDEFKLLSKTGIAGAWDAASKSEFTMKAHLLIVSTDMPARMKALKTLGFHSNSYCEYCHIRGLRYGGMHCPHKPPKNLADSPWIIQDQKDKIASGRVCYNWKKDYTAQNSTPRENTAFRQMAEYVEATKGTDAKYAEEVGISGESTFAELDTLMFPWSFPPCTMHLFYENVVQTMFEHYSGRYFVLSPAQKRNVRVPKWKKREDRNETFLKKNDEPYNIDPKDWKRMGKDTALSNVTFPDQFGEEIVNLTDTFRRMKAANWRRFVFLQSPIYFKKYLPKEDYVQWMNLVEAMRLSTRSTLTIVEVQEIQERFFQFVEYYERTFYQHDVDKVSACLPSIHQLRHIHEAILYCGPTYVYAQWCMERVNGLITSGIKSRTKPDENIATNIEAEIQCSLLTYVMPGMELIVARNNFLDSDGRLQIHKLFRHYIRAPEINEEDWGDEDRVNAMGRERPAWAEPSSRMDPELLESFITSGGYAVADENVAAFDLDIDSLEAEFGIRITPTDIRRALRRLGDVTMVDKVKTKATSPLLTHTEAVGLRDYLRLYYEDNPLKSGLVDEFFRLSNPQTGEPIHLLRDGIHAGITITKWRNIRFENITKLADYIVDRRVVRICGSHYPRVNRVRSASFFEFSRDNTMKMGAHIASCNYTERPASSRSDYPREFAEANFFVTVDIDWERFEGYARAELKQNGDNSSDTLPGIGLEGVGRPGGGSNYTSTRSMVSPSTHLQSTETNEVGHSGGSSAEKRDKQTAKSCREVHYLGNCSLLSARQVGALTVLRRIPERLRTNTRREKRTRFRTYTSSSTWLEVEDFVDLIGLMVCEDEEYVCWRDGCWDPVARARLEPLEWRFTPNPFTGAAPTYIPTPGTSDDEMDEDDTDGDMMSGMGNSLHSSRESSDDQLVSTDSDDNSTVEEDNDIDSLGHVSDEPGRTRPDGPRRGRRYQPSRYGSSKDSYKPGDNEGYGSSDS